MTQEKALALLEVLKSPTASLIDKERAAAQLEELICLLLPE
ncbi:MAG: hypothetical protein ACRC3G_02415 [Bacteroidales bacterium]